MGFKRRGLPARHLISTTLAQHQARQGELMASCFIHMTGVDAKLMRATIDSTRNMLVYFSLHLVLMTLKFFSFRFHRDNGIERLPWLFLAIPLALDTLFFIGLYGVRWLPHVNRIFKYRSTQSELTGAIRDWVTSQKPIPEKWRPFIRTESLKFLLGLADHEVSFYPLLTGARFKRLGLAGAEELFVATGGNKQDYLELAFINRQLLGLESASGPGRLSLNAFGFVGVFKRIFPQLFTNDAFGGLVANGFLLASIVNFEFFLELSDDVHLLSAAGKFIFLYVYYVAIANALDCLWQVFVNLFKAFKLALVPKKLMQRLNRSIVSANEVLGALILDGEQGKNIRDQLKERFLQECFMLLKPLSRWGVYLSLPELEALFDSRVKLPGVEQDLPVSGDSVLDPSRASSGQSTAVRGARKARKRKKKGGSTGQGSAGSGSSSGGRDKSRFRASAAPFVPAQPPLPPGPPPPLSLSQQLEGLIFGMQKDSTNAGKWMNISTYHYYLYLYGYHQALENRPLSSVPIDSDPAFFQSYSQGRYNGARELYYSAQYAFGPQ